MVATNEPSRAVAAPLSSDLMAALAHIESSFPVSTWQAAGISLWPLLRIRWMFAEWARHYTQGNSATGGGGAKDRLRRLIGGPAQARLAQRADARGRDNGPDRRDIVFLSDGVSFARLGEHWVERFCDPLLAQATRLGMSTALWTPGHQPRLPRLTPSRFIQPAIDRANIAGALRARVRPGPTVLPRQAEVVGWLTTQGFDAAPLSVAKIQSDAWRLQAVARLYERLLRRARPRLAFIVGFYGIEGMAFVLACRRCGVLVVDLQHGVQGELHPAYAAWSAPPPGGMHALLPDRFWVWSAWEGNAIARWSAGSGHAAVIGGNPWMDVWKAGSTWPGAAAALAAAQALRQRSGGRPVVLVTLQYGLADAEQLLPLAALLREAGQRLEFWVRLHPAMLERRESIRGLLNDAGRCELDTPTDLPLQALLPHADVHLTHSSTTVVEAAQFGLRSTVTTAYGAELFAPLFETGMAGLECGGPAALASTLDGLAAAVARRADTAPPLAAALNQLLASAAASRP